MSIVYALLAISLLIFIHETGHFLAARWCHIPVLTFAVGFGPALIKFQRKGTMYRLNLLPFGGYVNTPSEETKNSSVPVRLFFYSAGVLMNLLTAIVFLTIVFSFTGIPQPGGDGMLFESVSLFKGLLYATLMTFEMIAQGFSNFFHLFTGALSFDHLSGPLTMVKVTSEISAFGIEHFIIFLAFLSCQLAVLNLLPIPALDGSHLVFALLEVVRRGKKVSLEREAVVHLVGILAMFALMVAVTLKELHWLTF